MTKNSNIRGKQLRETVGGKPLCIIFAFAGITMLLVNAVVVMTELVHENVQQCERTRLRLREPTRDAILPAVVRNTERLKNLLVGIKIGGGQVRPKVVAPRVKENRSGLLTMVKLMRAIPSVAATRQHNALQSF